MQSNEVKLSHPQLYTEWPQDFIPKLTRAEFDILDESGLIFEKVGNYWVEFYIRLTPMPYSNRLILDEIDDLTLYHDFNGEAGAMVDTSDDFDQECATWIYESISRQYD